MILSPPAFFGKRRPRMRRSCQGQLKHASTAESTCAKLSRPSGGSRSTSSGESRSTPCPAR
eukprot:7159129-Pyramimonas_sp.AAC.1